MSEVLLELKGVSKSFGGVNAVSNVNLQLRRGEVLGLIGPNGAGKTTVFNMISGVQAPSAGSILLCGHEIGGLRRSCPACRSTRTWRWQRPSGRPPSDGRRTLPR
jgi:ABC-type branched-subunit amino acid transport system ATPase component